LGGGILVGGKGGKIAPSNQKPKNGRRKEKISQGVEKKKKKAKRRTKQPGETNQTCPRMRETNKIGGGGGKTRGRGWGGVTKSIRGGNQKPNQNSLKMRKKRKEDNEMTGPSLPSSQKGTPPVPQAPWGAVSLPGRKMLNISQTSTPKRGKKGTKIWKGRQAQGTTGNQHGKKVPEPHSWKREPSVPGKKRGGKHMQPKKEEAAY